MTRGDALEAGSGSVAKSRIHRIQYPHKQDGLTGLGLAMASLCAALPSVMQELAAAGLGSRDHGWKGIDP